MNPILAIPQADGDSRPYCGPIRVHVETRGPAFDGIQKQDTVMGAARRLQALSSKATVDVYRAVGRQLIVDLAPAWSRLLEAHGVEHLPVRVDLEITARHWDRVRNAVDLALSSVGEYTADMRWQHADVLIRATARLKAAELRRMIGIKSDKAWDDEQESYPEIMASQAHRSMQAQALEDFARGGR